MDSVCRNGIVNVARFLPLMAEERGDQPALRVPVGSGKEGMIRYDDYTFAELDREVDRRCRRLAGEGIVRGMRVLVLVKPGLELVALFFALFKIGAVPVLIDPGMGLRGFLNSVKISRPEAVVAITAGVWVRRIFRRAFRSVRILVPVGGGLEDSCGEIFPVAETRGEELAAILFTSGSTGPAKGVCYKHRMFEAQVEKIRSVYRIEPGEVDLPMLPVFALFNPALGMTTVIPEMNPSRPATVDPARIVQAIRQCGVTNSFGSPVLWTKIGRYCRENGIVLSGMRRILMAGAPVSPELVSGFRGILPDGEIHTPYGATESLPVSTISGEEILEKSVSGNVMGGTCVGRPLAGIEVRILPVSDRVEGRGFLERRLPAGEVGEIVVCGPVVTESYDGLPEETEMAKIVGDEGVWHRIGDLGYLDEEGNLWFCGRRAERVETESGVLYTDYCEAVFNRHPEVYRSALIGLGERPNQIPAIVVEPEAGRFPRNRRDRERFVSELRELGGEFPVTAGIERFFFRGKFPVDVRHNAKIHRRTLARYFEKKERKR